jgi:hypothetical protein
MIALAVLAIAADAAAPVYHWVPFVQPLYRGWDYWYLLMLPLCLAVAIVYKSIKCRSMSTVPREAAVTFFWIVGGIVLAAVLLAALVRVM